MLTAICISLAALIVASLVVVFVRSRRPAENPASDSTRRRAVLEDRGDDVVWEIGKLRPIVDTWDSEPRLTKRSFLKSAALSVSAFSVAWLASRGKNVALGSESPRPAGGGLFGKDRPIEEFSNQDYANHGDIHSDANGGGRNHGDSHSDSVGGHVDMGN